MASANKIGCICWKFTPGGAGDSGLDNKGGVGNARWPVVGVTADNVDLSDYDADSPDVDSSDRLVTLALNTENDENILDDGDMLICAPYDASDGADGAEDTVEVDANLYVHVNYDDNVP